VYGTPIGDLEQPAPLCGFKIANDFDLPLDMIHLPLLGLAVRALISSNFLVDQADGHAFKGKLLVIRVESERHGSTGTERGQKQVIGSWATVLTSDCDGLVGGQPMSAHGNFLSQLA
jgi:hypothetical protein